MNNEESRLRTFNIWPSDAPVDPVRIAKAGFFYTGQGLEVQCFACGGKITEWDYADQVMAKHRRLDPNCPFVINPSSSGNVPKLNSSPLPPLQPQSPVDSSIFREESARLQSFSNWSYSNTASPESLSKAGFYSLNDGDRVKCAYCEGIVGLWLSGDDPKTEHRRLFPSCSFVTANFNLTSNSQLTNTKLINAENLQELGIQTHKGPRQPRYSTLESRLRTFGAWSVDLIQTPEMLAEAGFYYVGTGDQVRCFHCDGGLRHWDPEDQPWVEHARWFPSCAFVRLIKGQDFILSCNPQELAHNHLTIAPRPTTTNGNRSSTNARLIPDQEIQTYMNTAPALAALGIGLPVDRVKQAIRLKIQDTGTSYNTADALIEAALNLQLEDSDIPPPIDVSQEIEHLLQRESARENEKSERIVEKNPDSNSEVDNSPKLSLEEENRQLKEARLCKICMDNEIGVVFLPCGHLTTCVQCAPSLKDCPVCRSVIKGTVRTFLS